MKLIKFILSILVIVSVLASVLYFVYKIGSEKYNRFGHQALEEKLNGKGVYDILFIGSSRTIYHINPKIIDSVTGRSSFNAGIDGANLLEANMVLQSYLSSHKPPKFVVLEIPISAFDIDFRPVFNPNIYYPFLDNEIVFSTLKPYKRVALLKYVPFLQLTEMDEKMKSDAIQGLLGKTKYKACDFYKGHLNSGMDTIRLPFKRTYLRTNYPVLKKGIGYLNKIIETCKQKNILLAIIYPPIWKRKDEELNHAFFPTIHQICKKNSLAFFNYRMIPICDDHRLFRDEHHLNKQGADIFSGILAKDLAAKLRNN